MLTTFHSYIIYRHFYHHTLVFFVSLSEVENVSWQGTGLFRELPQEISWRGRTGSVSPRAQMIEAPGRHPGPLGVCNPNEKQKPPALTKILSVAMH